MAKVKTGPRYSTAQNKPSLVKEVLENYELVFYLNFISKILLRVVVSQIQSHHDEASLVTGSQSAYSRHHSTEHALLNTKVDLHSMVKDLFQLSLSFMSLLLSVVLTTPVSWTGCTHTMVLVIWHFTGSNHACHIESSQLK